MFKKNTKTPSLSSMFYAVKRPMMGYSYDFVTFCRCKITFFPAFVSSSSVEADPVALYFPVIDWLMIEPAQLNL